MIELKDDSPLNVGALDDEYDEDCDGFDAVVITDEGPPSLLSPSSRNVRLEISDVVSGMG
jgi:hypothetical protein